MDTIEAIRSRRSTREFKDTEIPEPLLQAIIDCALSAPSSKNAQPWRLHVVKNRRLLRAIADLLQTPRALGTGPVDPETGARNHRYQPTVLESSGVLQNAPVALFLENTSPFIGGRNRVVESEHLTKVIYTYELEIMGLGAAVASALIGAHSLGIGAVFMGDILAEDDGIRQLLGMHGDLSGVIALGYAAESEEWVRSRRRDAVAYHE